ncbi:MAG: farnesyl diphosphate synthase [Pseudomonadota bacterium]|nr:farnesyl diphosphate synthase [Pseudomonadota bacterium]
MDFQQFTQECQKRIEAKLIEVLPHITDPPEKLHAAMQYAVLGNGKRLRPLLVYAAGYSFNVSPKILDAPAAAVEIMHAFSLIHDDLPAMDDDPLRRGKETLHIAFDEATAILAADALQPLAFEILTTDKFLKVNDKVRLKLVSILSKACGSSGMTGGQSIDLQAEGKTLSKNEIEHMYKLKTGELLHASVLMGASCGENCKDIDLEKLSLFIEKIGLAFQIHDDILDIEGETNTIGKIKGSDQKRSKATWPGILGINKAKARTEELLHQSLKEIEKFGPRADPLRDIAYYIVNRTK